MRHILESLLVFLFLHPAASAVTPISGDGSLNAQELRKIQYLIREADRLEHAGDPVKAYLALKEAYRLEQLWTSNTAGFEALSARRLERFTKLVVRREDGALAKILHSKDIPLGDKLGLIKQLEEDVILNFGGALSEDFLQGGDG